MRSRTRPTRRIAAALGLAFCVSAPARAHAQNSTYPAPPEAGYLEAFADAAFSQVTSQSYGVEFGATVGSHAQIYGDLGFVRDVTTADFASAAQTIAGGLARVQSNSGYAIKEPALFGLLGVRYGGIASQRAVRPYILVGGGFAHLKRETTFTVAGADVTGSLTQDQYGNIVLGSDLTGSTTKPMIEIGGGVVVPIAGRLLLDFRLRYDRLFTEGEAINLGRAGVGFGVRF